MVITSSALSPSKRQSESVSYPRKEFLSNLTLFIEKGVTRIKVYVPDEAVLRDLSFESMEFLTDHFDNYQGPEHVTVKNKTCAVVELAVFTNTLPSEARLESHLSVVVTIMH